MVTVKISPKYQVVIPKEIRNRMEIKPGQQMQLIQKGEKLEFIPLKDIKEMKGFLKGIDTEIERDKDRI